MSYKDKLAENRKQLLTNMKQTVEKHSSDAVFGFEDLMKSVNRGTFSPVKTVENMLGIGGVSQEYNFPENISPLEYEAYMYPANIFQIDERGCIDNDSQEALLVLKKFEPQCKDYIIDMYNALVDLNPELKEIPVDTKKSYGYISIISGACSSFPIDDIKTFCTAVFEKDSAKMQELNNNREEYSQKIRGLIKTKGMPRNSRDQQLLQTRMHKESIFKNWAPTEKSFNKIYSKLNSNLEYQKVQDYEDFLSKRYHD